MAEGPGTFAGTLENESRGAFRSAFGEDTGVERFLNTGLNGEYIPYGTTLQDTTKRLTSEVGDLLRGGASSVLGGTEEDYKFEPSVKGVRDIEGVGDAAAFATEGLASSLAHMATAAVSLPALIGSIGGDVAEQRAKNNSDGKRSLPDMGELAVGTAAALPSAILERFATKALLGGGSAGRSVGKGFGVQVGTESVEEGIESLGGQAGTKKGTDWGTVRDAMVAGGLVGSIPGAAQVALDANARRSSGDPEAEAEPEISEEEAAAQVREALGPQLREAGMTEEQIAAATPDFMAKAVERLTVRRAKDADPATALRRQRLDDRGPSTATTAAETVRTSEADIERSRAEAAREAERSIPTNERTADRKAKVDELLAALDAGDGATADRIVAELQAISAEPKGPPALPGIEEGRAKTLKDRSQYYEERAAELTEKGDTEGAAQAQALAEQARGDSQKLNVGDANTKAAAEQNSPEELQLSAPDKIAEPPRDPAMTEEEIAFSKRSNAARPQRTGAAGQEAERAKAIEAAERKVAGLERRQNTAKKEATRAKIQRNIDAAKDAAAALRLEQDAIQGDASKLAAREGGNATVRESETGRDREADAFTLAERQRQRVARLRERDGQDPVDDKPGSFEETKTPEFDTTGWAEGRPVEQEGEVFEHQEGAPDPVSGEAKPGDLMVRVRPMRRNQETGRMESDPNAEPFVVAADQFTSRDIPTRPRAQQERETRRGQDKLDPQNATFAETADDPSDKRDGTRSDRPQQGPGPRTDAPPKKGQGPQFREEDLKRAMDDLDEFMRKQKEEAAAQQEEAKSQRRSGRQEEQREDPNRREQKQRERRQQKDQKPTSNKPKRGGPNDAPTADADGYILSDAGGPIAFNPDTQKRDYAKLILELQQSDPDGRYEREIHPYATFSAGRGGSTGAITVRKVNHKADEGRSDFYTYSNPFMNPKLILGKETYGDLVNLLKQTTSLVSSSGGLLKNELKAVVQNARDVAEFVRSNWGKETDLSTKWEGVRKVANVVAFTNDEAIRYLAKLTNSEKLHDVRSWLHSSLGQREGRHDIP